MNLFPYKRLNKWLLTLGLMISYLIFEIVYILIGIDLTNLTFDMYLLLTIIKYSFFMLLLIIIYRKYLKEKWFDFRKNFSKYMKISIKDWYVGILIMLFSNIIINQFIPNLGENEETIQSMITLSPIYALIFTSFFAPFNEEMIYRKSLQNCFNNKYLFMIVSGLIFGFIHVMGSNNPYEYLLIIPYGALGFMFAHTLSKTDNIYCTIIMHMMHNFILTIISMVI